MQGSPDVTGSPEAPELPTEKAFVLQLTRETGASLEPFAGRVEHVASAVASGSGTLPPFGRP